MPIGKEAIRDLCGWCMTAQARGVLRTLIASKLIYFVDLSRHPNHINLHPYFPNNNSVSLGEGISA